MLDTPDAFCLPSAPGNGYLKVDVTGYEKFKVTYVSGPLPGGGEPEAAPVVGPRVKPMPRFGRPPGVSGADQDRAVPRARAAGPTLLSTVVDQIARTGRGVPPIWLPPLPAALTLDRVSGGFEITPSGVRLRLAAPCQPGLRVPIGLLDDPARPWQGPWLLDLSRAGGNLLVLGGPGTGKSTALRTLALGLATTQTPTDVGIYAVDLLGSGLRALSGLPHVGGVASRDPATAGSAPRIMLLVDDYDILAASATQPLGALVPSLAAGRDLGLHVAVTRRVAGSARGLYEPPSLGVREAGCLALLMSGDRSEGQLIAGVRPTTLPVGRAQ